MTMSAAPEALLHGLILAGGKSSRMKSEKAHLFMTDAPQWRVARDALSPFCSEVFFSVSPQLSEPIPVEKKYVIEDIFHQPCGPLGGIISAAKKMPSSAFLVLACDMPFFDREAVSFLIKHRNTAKLATVYVNEQDQIEALCAIYEPAIFSHLLLGWSQDELCPRKLLSKIDIERIPVPDQRYLQNINDAHELSKLKSAYAQAKKVVVHFYASLKHQAHQDSQELRSSADTVLELYFELKQKYNFIDDAQSMRFAKNDCLVAAQEHFDDGDTIVFLPPVSGG